MLHHPARGRIGVKQTDVGCEGEMLRLAINLNQIHVTRLRILQVNSAHLAFADMLQLTAIGPSAISVRVERGQLQFGGNANHHACAIDAYVLQPPLMMERCAEPGAGCTNDILAHHGHALGSG